MLCVKKVDEFLSKRIKPKNDIHDEEWLTLSNDFTLDPLKFFFFFFFPLSIYDYYNIKEWKKGR
jgi:hypothetical protein